MKVVETSFGTGCKKVLKWLIQKGSAVVSNDLALI